MATLNTDKRIFCVHVDPRYWEFRHLGWNDFAPEVKQQLVNQEYSEIDERLSNAEKSITIFAPIVDGCKLIQVEQISGEKDAEIIYTDKPYI